MSIRSLALVCFAICCLCVGPSLADEIHLKSGQVIVGEVVKETKTHVRVRVKRAGIEAELTFGRADILKIVRGSEIEKEYQERLEETDEKSGVGLLILARWCHEKKLGDLAKKHGMEAVKIGGTAESSARTFMEELGFLEVDDVWLPKAEALERQGKTEMGGRIVPKEEADAKRSVGRASIRVNGARADVKKLTRWVGRLNKKISKANGEIFALGNTIKRTGSAYEASVKPLSESAARLQELKAALDKALATAAYEQRTYKRVTDATAARVRNARQSHNEEVRIYNGIVKYREELAAVFKQARRDLKKARKELAKEQKLRNKKDSELAKVEGRLARAAQDLAVAKDPDSWSVGEGAGAGAESTLAKALRRSVVMIWCQLSDGTFVQGSGFFVSGSGHIVTNKHVIEGARDIRLYWDSAVGRDSAKAIVIRRAPGKTDLALLAVQGAPKGTLFPPLPLSFDYPLTCPVMTVGFPLANEAAKEFGTRATDIVISRGVLSSVRRDENDAVQALQTDAEAASGSSGGPLVDVREGSVLGVVTRAWGPAIKEAVGDVSQMTIPATKIREEFGRFLRPD